MSYIEIQTTQNIHLEYETASVGERFIAAALDRILWFFWFLLWYFIIDGLNLKSSLFLVILIAAPVLFYYLCCELLFNGQSVGKRIMSIRVAKVDGTSPSFGDYFLRWIFRLLENTATAAIAIVSMMCTAKCQRLGDLAAKTCVIRTRQKAKLTELPVVDSNHEVFFPSATLLSDKDVSLISQIITNPAIVQNKKGLKQLADKVKDITQTQSESHDLVYLRRILSDYNYLAGKL
ncbi:MAG: RDD family protein [Bacteroidales bacterium]|jgi:uncharacterized RDD family membrane protein YckC|nr:RDD family protein [Bacteroidales bacterium]